MNSFNLDREIARLILLQRSQFASPVLKKIRKILGRYIYTNFISRFLISPKSIGYKYYDAMMREYTSLSNYLDFKDKKILSIGSGMCGLELIINSNSMNNFFTIVEKNYVSKKVAYGWDDQNKEAYNNINLLKSFLSRNGMGINDYEIFDYDKDILPFNSYDYIISLYSLDYHYNFSYYLKYLKHVMNESTEIIFDTIRPDYFSNIFEYVRIIETEQKFIHSSKRIICKNFI
tara:strand:+ start:521 stop:1216 length:696 start_codon:yes stop_codon:yes gene_type:complete